MYENIYPLGCGAHTCNRTGKFGPASTWKAYQGGPKHVNSCVHVGNITTQILQNGVVGAPMPILH